MSSCKYCKERWVFLIDNRVMIRIMAFLMLAIFISPVHAAPLLTGFTDDTSVLISYAGAWAEEENAAAIGVGYSSTVDVNAELTFETIASGFNVFFFFDPLGAEIEVCVDDTCTTINTLGASGVGSAEFVDLELRTKTVTISKTTDDGNVFQFDAVYIHPQLQQEVNPTETIISNAYELEDGATYTGSIHMRIDAGDIAIVVMLGFIAVIHMVQFISERISA